MGSKSPESYKDVILSPRLELDFDCPAHHHFSATFAAEASLPALWDCPTCWAPAVRSDGVRATAEPDKPIRTPWVHLRERRSLAELEVILAERLALLRAGAIGPNVPVWIAPRKMNPA